MFFSNKFISYVSSYVGPIQTGFLRGFKKLQLIRNRDSCEKSATGMENTGMRRIPAGIGNLGVSVSGVVIIIVEDIVVDVRSEDCHVLSCVGGHGSVRKSQPHVHCLLLVSEFSFHK